MEADILGWLIVAGLIGAAVGIGILSIIRISAEDKAERNDDGPL